MKNFFNLDNPVFQVLARMADLVIVSLLCLICCVPIVTIGPALAALYKTVYDLTLERCSGTVHTFFRAFKSNLKQGMIAGIAGTLALISLVCDFLLLRVYYEGSAYTVLVCLLFLLAFLTLGVLSYLFPLIGRYENDLRQHFQNALILLIRYLPKTIMMVFLHLLPFFLLLFATNVFLYTLIFWIFIGFGAIAQADSFLLRPIFDKLEQPQETPSGENAVSDD